MLHAVCGAMSECPMAGHDEVCRVCCHVPTKSQNKKNFIVHHQPPPVTLVLCTLLLHHSASVSVTVRAHGRRAPSPLFASSVCSLACSLACSPAMHPPLSMANVNALAFSSMLQDLRHSSYNYRVWLHSFPTSNMLLANIVYNKEASLPISTR